MLGIRRGLTFLDSILLGIISKITPSECSRLGMSKLYINNKDVSGKRTFTRKGRTIDEVFYSERGATGLTL
jgi:hypothetical protein